MLEPKSGHYPLSKDQLHSFSLPSLFKTLEVAARALLIYTSLVQSRHWLTGCLGGVVVMACKQQENLVKYKEFFHQWDGSLGEQVQNGSFHHQRWPELSWTWPWASYSTAKFGPALNSEFRPKDIQRFLPTQPILWLCDEEKKKKKEKSKLKSNL